MDSPYWRMWLVRFCRLQQAGACLFERQCMLMMQLKLYRMLMM